MFSIPQSALSALSDLVVAEMRDWCVIRREALGPGTFDEGTGRTTIATTLIYEGPCLIGDRVEGAYASGGFGANPQEWAFDARTHNEFLRLPPCEKAPQTGDLVEVRGGDSWRITAKERGTHRVSSSYRMVRYDQDASRG